MDVTDDFGNRIDCMLDGTPAGIATFNRHVRWRIDGMWEGIAAGILEGKTNDDSFRHFGIIS
ncbi:hypothetical protein [Burkholderia phage vB_BglM_WTB]